MKKLDFGMGKMAYGGDWYPEQWDAATEAEDFRLFEEAGIDFPRINIFGWTMDQPSEDEYSLDWLARVVDGIAARGMKCCMGTGTGAHPAWMATRHPDILRVDFQGRKRKFGDRHNSCPSSPTYRLYGPRLAGELARRFGKHPAVALWNVSNEFMGACYCPNCEAAFRDWLRARYGTVGALNEAWNARFWSQSYSAFDEVVLPNALTVQWGDRNTAMQGISLDYMRFNSDNILECYKRERDAVKREAPDAVVTTNLMGPYRQLDYRKWAREMDVVGWDSYPSLGESPQATAMKHDLMRGLKGRSFLLMEQTPSQTNWQRHNSLKRPGVMRLQSLQAVARGSDSVLFFQMRRTRGSCEKFHGAVIEHSGRGDTRVFREVAALGAELRAMGSAFVGSDVVSRAALVFDWESWWAVENSMGPNADLEYYPTLAAWHAALHSRGISVDVVGPEDDFSRYSLVLAPLLYMIRPGQAEALARYVEAGGVLLAGFLSGVAGPSDLVFRGGAPGPLKGLFGLWVEETDALPPERANPAVFAKGKRVGSCSMIFDVVHAEGAEVLARYGADFYAGSPLLTRKRSGKGSAWYLASKPDDALIAEVARLLAEEAKLGPVLPGAPEGIEASVRAGGGMEWLFVLNHGEAARKVDLGKRAGKDLLTGKRAAGKVELAAKGALVIELE